MQISHSLDEKDIFIRCNQFRGALALIVLFSHIWGYTGLLFLVPFNKMVTIAVSMFFFLSGYGMVRSAKLKRDYIREIYSFKIPYLLYMAIFSYVFSIIIQQLANKFTNNTIKVIHTGVEGPFIDTNWYVYELIVFYVLFSIALSFKQPIKRFLFVFICSVIGFVLLFYSGLVEAYYNSIIGFSVGMLIGIVDYTLFLKRYKYGYFLGVIILLIAFALMFILKKDTLLFAVIRNVAAVGAIIVLIYLCSYMKINVKINDYLCRISPELYFYHMPIALIFSKVTLSSYAYMGIVIVLSIFFAILFNLINNKVKAIWKNMITKGENSDKTSS